tara:strand:- start:656 stop:835 length:180 start_codon:yes stop_codon:yes gene_type:complete
LKEDIVDLDSGIEDVQLVIVEPEMETSVVTLSAKDDCNDSVNGGRVVVEELLDDVDAFE